MKTDAGDADADAGSADAGDVEDDVADDQKRVRSESSSPPVVAGTHLGSNL